MPRSYRYYDLIMAAFVCVLLCSNLIGAAKAAVVTLPLLGEVTFSAGVLFFPISYIFGDILTEVYGYGRDRRVVWAGFAALAFASFMAWVARGWLGVVIQEVTSELAESFGLDRARGALVAEIQEDSPAARGGIQVSDVLLKFDNKPVENSGDLPRLVANVKPGSKVPVQVWRKGANKELFINVGEFPDEGKTAFGPKTQKSFSRGGLVLAELSKEQRKELKVNGGLLVEESKGDAVRAGIRVGDIILAVNNTEVGTVEQFRKLIAAVPVGKSAAVLVRRGDNSLYIPLKISNGSSE